MILRRVVPALACAAVLAAGLDAHHIMGIPHYAYDKNYPQAPVITYKVAAGPYIVELTGYPGKPVPGEMAQMHAYVYRKGAKRDVFTGKIVARVDKKELGGRRTVFGPVTTRFEEKLHKFSPTYKEAGKYIVRFEMQIEGQPYQIDLPIVVGDPASPLGVVAKWLGALVLFVVVIRAVKIKLERARRAAAPA